ncbi:MAG: hypothetical protein OMM_09413 [Candidatus Magnetoglobus multicellularis str. Araruama]|uniref:Uncharacterized protein n=1 Tax=Candidatus Magnetoglobus multicellularis str. Araruama TaxID=890399 RepID=A0A1V1P4C7_9BACT|nr:MAG: hypothetical protein OMM_09413 [Candidatus Magnetoglobus multicellularis str. Araruama]
MRMERLVLMDLYSIKQAVNDLSHTDFFRFFDWFEQYGWERINKFTKSSKLRQAVIDLSEKELFVFADWLDILWSERWNEEVENNPIARQCRALGNIIMSDPNKLTAYLHGLSND